MRGAGQGVVGRTIPLRDPASAVRKNTPAATCRRKRGAPTPRGSRRLRRIFSSDARAACSEGSLRGMSVRRRPVRARQRRSQCGVSRWFCGTPRDVANDKAHALARHNLQDWSGAMILRRNPSERAAQASDGKMTRRRRSPRWVTQRVSLGSSGVGPSACRRQVSSDRGN